MPRVYRVKKCRKPQGTCSKCGAKIEKGDPYVYWQFAYSPVSVRCASPSCYPKSSELTRSEFYSTLYEIQERNVPDELDEMESFIEEIKGDLETLRDEQQEKLDNMPDGLRDGDTGQLLQERYDNVDNAVNELESIDLEFEEPEVEKEEESFFFRDLFFSFIRSWNERKKTLGLDSK